VAIKSVTDEEDLMIINKSGIAIRMAVADLRVMGRATQGVRLINLKGSDSIAAVAKVMKEEEDENEALLDEDGNIIETEQDTDNGTTFDTDENELNNNN